MNPITNVLPLVLVLAVSLAKEAFEDRKRAAKDKEVCPGPLERCYAHRTYKLDLLTGQTMGLRSFAGTDRSCDHG